MSAIVRTVLGDIAPDELGHTQTHEHLLIDLRRKVPEHAPEEYRLVDEQPITLENLFRHRWWRTSQDSLLDDREIAAAELGAFREAGGRAIVDATSIGLARDPEGIAWISRATGVHVVMGSSFYHRDHHPDWLDDLSVDAIAELIVRDVEEGAQGTAIRAGLIGEVGMSWPHHPVEERVLRASVLAQQECGAALLVHPGRAAESAFEIMRIVGEMGGDPSRVVMAHLDRTLLELDDLLRFAELGSYLEYDLFGQEWSFYIAAPIDMPNDAQRIDRIRALVDAGYGDRVLMAQDICHKTHLTRWGGEGWRHIIDHVIPVMLRKGMTAEQIEAITVQNPARVLAFEARR